MKSIFGTIGLIVVGACLVWGQEKKAMVVEEIVARVNNEIITTSDYKRAQVTLRQELAEDCESCTEEQVEAKYREREKTLLSELIDQSLLVQRGKEMGLNVEADVIKQLDAIRQRNNLPSMEALEDALRKAGLVPEDFKANMRNGLLTQEVMRREIRMQFTREEIQKYYDEHPQEFVRPEKVFLSEIFITTEGKTPEELPLQEQRAKVMQERLKRGEDFEELAKRFSDGSTALQGGQLGGFERGQLDPELEKTVFQMNRGDYTDIIRTQTGFLILRVDQRYEEGLQPLDRVENEIINRLYMTKMQPALRAYVKKLREESLVSVKPGYVDSSAVAYIPIEEIPADAGESQDGKKKKKKGKQSGGD